jgi:membrane fusion protein (multidrug efflux system)
MEEAKAGMEISEARIEELEVTLSKLKLTAPFDGTMGIIEVSKGAYVQPNQVLGSFVDNSFMHIDFKIPEKFINDVGAGQVVEVTLNSLDQVFEGTVEAVEPKSESESHSVKIRAGMENYQNLLRHGMFCSISLIIGEKSNALSIEEHAVEVEGEAEYVWVIEKGKAMKRRVMTGSKEKGRVEILAGLEAGELVVIAGQLKLYPGSKVKITNLSAEEGQKNKEEKEHEKPIEKISKKFKVKRKGQKK